MKGRISSALRTITAQRSSFLLEALAGELESAAVFGDGADASGHRPVPRDAVFSVLCQHEPKAPHPHLAFCDDAGRQVVLALSWRQQRECAASVLCLGE